MSEKDRRHALFNTNIQPGTDLCQEFLHTREFTKETLGKLLRRPVDKNTLVAEIANNALRDAAYAERVVLEFCKQPRTWLAFRKAKPTKAPVAQGTAQALLGEFGRGGWYGPFVENAATHWLVYCHIAPHFYISRTEGSARFFGQMPARWHIVARAAGDSVSIHWNNFSYNETETDAGTDAFRQFQYWRHAPQVLAELVSLYGAEPDQTIPLHSFVLHTLYDRYPESASGNWQHLKVRAMTEGVSLNASGKEENDFSGIQKLTRSLARIALQELGHAETDENLANLDRAFLRTVLRQWGLKSYNFSVTTPDTRSFRANCFFGVDPKSDSSDCFPHLLCLVGRGGGLAALEFLLTEMNA